ncbi:MAG: type II toxin-antitoxin system VapC family toxin [Chloroflexota bacterium]|nr:MAG: type II toxin-antitoxin system VapC family toxin [Chloroflexota bacterium]
MGERSSARGVTLDTGALIAFERGDQRMRQLIREALLSQAILVIPVGVVAQVWRNGRRQVELGSLLRAGNVRVDPLTQVLAMAIGELCAKRHTGDVIDASVVLAAHRFHTTVVTSDPDDIRHLDPSLRIRGI